VVKALQLENPLLGKDDLHMTGNFLYTVQGRSKPNGVIESASRNDDVGTLSSLPDTELVRRCLNDSQEAWCQLIDKYRKLIFSIPVKYGLNRDDATEVFQDVCLTLLRELPRLREPRTLAAWLIRVTSHRCLHWRADQSRLVYSEMACQDETAIERHRQAEVMEYELEREQALREALSKMAGRCKELIRMLFFSTPAVPYEEAAARLGLATGSIGFVRMRCLKRLRRILEERGFA
jgi:RNA polymerase sigma factor (sigma-70 family)